MEERIILFLAEIESQWKEILKVHSAVEKKTEQLKKDMDNEDLTNSLAYKLHNLYSAYEDIFKLIARFFENQIDNVARYHIDLLKRMLIEIEGIRPSFLSEESFILLDELRGFRHLFRHAYGYAIETESVIRLADKSRMLKAIFQRDFELFKQNLKACLQSVNSSKP